MCSGEPYLSMLDIACATSVMLSGRSDGDLASMRRISASSAGGTEGATELGGRGIFIW